MNRFFTGFLFAVMLRAQDVDLHLYSEFQRIRPDGSIVEADRADVPQEIISPAIIRNGFTTFHVAVTGRPRILYWMVIQTNPASVFRIRVYREEHGNSGIPDRLIEEAKPLYFLGVMPDLPVERTTQVYLIDIWTPSDTPVDRVRFEVLVKTGEWVVAPMEVRVIAARVPDRPENGCCEELPEPDRPADTSAWPPLFAALAGGASPLPPTPGTVRSVIMRNAMQDAALARSFDAQARSSLLDRAWPAMFGRLPLGPASLRGNAEAYLPLRRRIWGIANDRMQNDRLR
jgi:hypothetical protein